MTVARHWSVAGVALALWPERGEEGVAGRWPAAWRGQSVTEEHGTGHSGGTSRTQAGVVQREEEECSLGQSAVTSQ